MRSSKEVYEDLWSELFNLRDGEVGAPNACARLIEELIDAKIAELKILPTGPGDLK